MQTTLKYLNDFDGLKRYLHLNEISRSIEFGARILLVNFPLYIFAKFPEVDRLSSITLGYLFFQVVGLCWAFLVNASFALACKSAMFVPGNVSTGRLIVNFYVHYASIRTVISFAQSHAQIAFDMINDFSIFSKFIDTTGIKIFEYHHLLFVPCIILEVCLLSADVICSSANNLRTTICLTTGLQYVTSYYTTARFLIFVSTAIILLQLWQIFLRQFPQWTDAFRAMSRPIRRSFQLSAVILIILQFVAPFRSFDSALIVLIGWTIWLWAFVPTLVQKYSTDWTEKKNVKYASHVAAYIRFSLVLIFFLAFANICFFRGILRAHLEITFITIIVPMIYTIVYILMNAAQKAYWTFVLAILAVAFLVTYVVSYFSSVGSQGSFLMVFTHIITKMMQYLGSDDNISLGYDLDDGEIGNIETIRSSSSVNNLSSGNSSENTPNLPKSRSAESLHSELSTVSSVEDKSLIEEPLPTPAKLSLESLNRRGEVNSSLVSLNIGKYLGNHWAIRYSKTTLAFFVNLVRKLTIGDSFTTGLVKIATAFVVVLSIFLSIISLASIVQQNLNIFPKLITFHDSGQEILIDHTITNLTLNKVSNYSTDSTECRNTQLKPPEYLACDLKWHGYTALDLALLSEISYLDDENLDPVIRSIFPYQRDLQVNNFRRVKDGPKYIEVFDPNNKVTVVAIRGTDVARLHDFLEDFKLYTEPVVFSILSHVFPTIRLWSQATTSAVIQSLHDFNVFFGLQEEAEYYQPLLRRVLELADRGHHIILTGHSLGGGLARIVGSMTGQMSISFHPPGAALSYRKFAAVDTNGVTYSIENSGKLHHKSFSIVTEYDWITQIDDQVGLVQKVMCEKEDKAHQNACHLLEGTICHLLEHCGDRQHRFDSCKFTFDFGAIYPSLWQFFSKHKFFLFPILFIIPSIVVLAIMSEML